MRVVLKSECVQCELDSKICFAHLVLLCFSEVESKSDEDIQALMDTVQEVYSGRSIG